MQSSTPNEIIFFVGVFLILGIFLYVLILRFKEDDKIDFKKHYTFLIIYIILLIGSIYTWRIFYKMIWQTYQQALHKSIPPRIEDEEEKNNF